MVEQPTSDEVVVEWMDHDDPLETRMFYELMQGYRYAERLNVLSAHEAFEHVKKFIRDHYTAAGKTEVNK